MGGFTTAHGFFVFGVMGHCGRWFMALFYFSNCFIQHASRMAIFLRKAKTSRRDMTAKSQDDHGYFGRFGGRFVPETLMTPLSEFEVAYRPLKHLRYGIEQSILLNYTSQTMDNRLVTSSTLILRDHKKKPVVAICINFAVGDILHINKATCTENVWLTLERMRKVEGRIN